MKNLSLCFLCSLWLMAFFWKAPVFALDPQKSITQYIHTFWQSELPQSTILAITQTREGYIWLGTYEGLVRFDGINFTVFDRANTPELHANGISFLYEDRKDRLWIGTLGGGLVCYKNGRFASYARDGLADSIVYAACEDRAGDIWIASNAGLFRLKDENLTAYTVKDGLPDNVIRYVYEDSKGELWVSPLGSGLGRFKDGKYAPYFDSDNPAQLVLSSICEDRKGNLWIATNGGLKCLKDGKFTTYTIKEGLSDNIVRAVFTDRDDNLWIGTNGGVTRFSNGKFVSLSAAQGLTHNFVRSIFEDREGGIWIGTNSGLNLFSDGIFTSYTALDGLVNDFARTVTEDLEGNVWIGTDDGLSCMKEGRIVNYTTKDGLPSNVIKSVYADRDGNLWLGTSNGLSRFREGKFTNYGKRDGLPQDYMDVIYQDRSGSVWIGTASSGLILLKDGEVKFYTTSDGLTNDIVRAICEDRNGNLWVGTNGGGLNKFKDGVFTRYTTKEGLSSNVVFVVFEDSKGDLWVGTDNGLNRFRDGKIKVYTTRDGLFDNIAFQILEDRKGDFWMGCNKGIYRLPKKMFDDYDEGKIKTLKCNVYGRADGMGSNQCNGAAQPAGWKTADGRLLFPTAKGLTVIDPDKLRVNSLPPPVVVERFVSDDESMGLDGILSIEPGKKRFEFHYAGLSFLSPQRVRFKYKLEGFDGDWIDAGGLRAAYYTNIPPGDYEFKVTAGNSDGIWNAAGASVRFKLKAPWWLTWWAYGLYGIIGTVAVYGGVRARLHALRRRNELLEAEVQKRTAELADAVEQQRLSKLETEKRNEQLKAAKDELEHKNVELDKRFEELAEKNRELIASQIQADRIFSALADALPGTVLDGKYRLDVKIGTGGFGAVFRGTHLALNREVAIKVFRPSPGNDSPEAVERFRQEAVSACRVNHPNAITILDSGISTEGIAYIVMELLKGYSLAQELHKRGPLTLERCAKILTPVCEVLAQAHASGIIHRDIKPDNIFLHQSPEGEIVKVLDFGIAKLIETDADSGRQMMTTGALLGTPVYMSPERLRREAYDGRADVYALGITLYQMLCGRTPFKSDGKGVIDVMLGHLSKPPQSLKEIIPMMPAEVEETVMRALSKNPALRPTAKQLAEDFSNAVDGLPKELLEEINKFSGEHPKETDPALMATEEFTNADLDRLDTNFTGEITQIREFAGTISGEKPLAGDTANGKGETAETNAGLTTGSNKGSLNSQREKEDL